MVVNRSCQWAEGTTRGDPIAVALFVLSTQPMITCLQVASTAKQSCFPNDTEWWDRLYYGNEIVGNAEYSGFRFWFLPKQRGKGWIVAKPNKTENVKEAFKEKDINITL